MTALSLELWVSSFVMLCQAFTAADFSCCLFVGRAAFSFVFSKWNSCSIGLRSGDWLGHCRIFHFITFKNSWVAFAGCFGSSSICAKKHHPINFAAFGWIWAESISLYTSKFIRLLLSSVTSPLNTSNPVPLEAMHAHASHCLHHVSQMMLYGSWAVPSLFHSHFFFPSFWCMLILIPAVQRMLFQKCSGFFRCFFFFWPCFLLVVNPLYLLSWSLLLIVDFYSDTLTSWRVYIS